MSAEGQGPTSSAGKVWYDVLSRTLHVGDVQVAAEVVRRLHREGVRVDGVPVNDRPAQLEAIAREVAAGRLK